MSAIYRTPAGEQAVREAYLAVLAHWPIPHEQLRIPTRQGETFVLASGPADALPLVVFHGAHANAARWMREAAAWSQHFRVYAVDVIGDAGLSAPSRPPLANEDHALWLDDLLAGLELDKVALLGESLGGWLAIDYATRRPERVTQLVLLCPAGTGAQKNLLLKALPLLLLGSWGAHKLTELVLGPPPLGPSPLESQVGELMNLIFQHAHRRMIKIAPFSDEALKRLAMPVLAIVGGKDVLLDSAGTRRRLSANLAHAQVIYLPEGRHLLPDQTETVLNFLQHRP
ncbi:alpha/beta hydrolase [Phenylobacterium sp.]|uniref:alpha/beta fold hydrolase n=1 Tax=Phenylobacterium sp. TaxID=1871053 RepID=UPI0030F38887